MKGKQLDLFDPTWLRADKLNETLAKIRKDFGEKAVIQGKQLPEPRGKRNVKK